MAQNQFFLGRYKGPVIVLALAATLIVAAALPKDEHAVVKTKSVEFLSSWDASVKRAEVQVGQEVKPGDILVVLTDPALEEEILQLESELKLAMLGTKEAVVQEPIMGMIGSLPKVVWDTVTVPVADKSESKVEPDPAKVTAPKAVQPTSASEKEVEVAMNKVFNQKIEVTAAEGALSEAQSALSASKAALATAEATHESNVRQKERFEKLYEMGAIAKNKLDAGVTAFDESAKTLEAAKAKVSEAEAAMASAEKALRESKQSLEAFEAQLNKVRSKPTVFSSVQKPGPSTEPSAKDQPKPQMVTKKVKRVVYGTSAQTPGVAPLQVDLVDSTDPNEEKRIEAIRAKLVSLKKEREALKLVATGPGRIIFVVSPGTDVKVNDKLVAIQPLS